MIYDLQLIQKKLRTGGACFFILFVSEIQNEF